MTLTLPFSFILLLSFFFLVLSKVHSHYYLTLPSGLYSLFFPTYYIFILRAFTCQFSLLLLLCHCYIVFSVFPVVLQFPLLEILIRLENYEFSLTDVRTIFTPRSIHVYARKIHNLIFSSFWQTLQT